MQNIDPRAWTYQAPYIPASDPNQRYYGAVRMLSVQAVYPKQRAPRPQVIVYRNADRNEDGIEIEVGTGCGDSRILLGVQAALALRNALNDAIEDIVQAQLQAQLQAAAQQRKEVPA